MNKSLFVVLLGAFFLGASRLPAAIVFNDTFEDIGGTATKLDDAGDPNDIAWYSSLANGAASMANDTFAGGGSLRALAFSSPDTFRRMGGNFPSTTISNTIGDSLTLSFAMRLSEAPTSNQYGFRFGLFNSAGTNITSDNPNGSGQPAQQNDDFGYHVRFSTGAPGTLSNEIYDEPAGDNPAGGTTGGTLISTHVGSPAAINNQTLHTLSLKLTRDTATSLAFELYYDGVLKATGSDATPVSTFDTVYFAQGSISTDFLVDNVQVSTAAIPEPTTWGLAGLASLVYFYRRRGR